MRFRFCNPLQSCTKPNQTKASGAEKPCLQILEQRSPEEEKTVEENNQRGVADQWMNAVAPRSTQIQPHNEGSQNDLFPRHQLQRPQNNADS